MLGKVAGTVVAVSAVAIAGGVLFKVFQKDSPDKKAGGSTANEADACDNSMDALPEPYRSMLLSTSTDLSDPMVIDTIAGELDTVGYKVQANCLRKFKGDIVAHNQVSAADVANNCEGYVDETNGLTDVQRAAVKAAIKNGDATALAALSKAVLPVNAKLSHCIDAVAKGRFATGGGSSLSKETLDILNGVSGKGAAPISEEESLFRASMVG